MRIGVFNENNERTRRGKMDVSKNNKTSSIIIIVIIIIIINNNLL